MALKSWYIKPRYTVVKPYACGGTEALLVCGYKLVSVNKEFHTIAQLKYLFFRISSINIALRNLLIAPCFLHELAQRFALYLIELNCFSMMHSNAPLLHNTRPPHVI